MKNKEKQARNLEVLIDLSYGEYCRAWDEEADYYRTLRGAQPNSLLCEKFDQKRADAHSRYLLLLAQR